MSLFHRHHWREKERFYAPPTPVPNYGSEATRKQARHGFTTIVQECFHCGDLKTIQVLGDARRPGQ